MLILGREMILILILIWINQMITKKVIISIVIGIVYINFINSPDRDTTFAREKTVYAPSEGYIQEITIENGNIEASIFLNLMDNHTQYIPIESKVIKIDKIRGNYNKAYTSHSINNERVEYTMETKEEVRYKIKQITGLLTRRIKTMVEEGNTKYYKVGERLGFIMLGSRVDIIFPIQSVKEIKIKKGQKIKEMTEMFTLI